MVKIHFISKHLQIDADININHSRETTISPTFMIAKHHRSVLTRYSHIRHHVHSIHLENYIEVTKRTVVIADVFNN